jgi:putative restriction endonuclease
MTDTVAQELERREAAWHALLERGGPIGVSPGLVRELNLYSGARGIWMHAEETRDLAPDGGAVAVGLLHTGKLYPDDLSSDGILYHYPVTEVPGRDANEIAAMKAASQLSLPVFVITSSPGDSRLRDVHKGWIEGWEDSAQMVLVAFQEEPPQSAEPELVDGEPFELTGATIEAGPQMVASRPGQARFKFRVLQRYGPRCAVCHVDVPELLDAAHIRDKRYEGSDDPRNGLVLCSLHHRAFDRALFGIEPETLDVHLAGDPLTFERLRITRPSLSNLARAPHIDALRWRWDRWSEEVRGH